MHCHSIIETLTIQVGILPDTDHSIESIAFWTASAQLETCFFFSGSSFFSGSADLTEVCSAGFGAEEGGFACAEALRFGFSRRTGFPSLSWRRPSLFFPFWLFPP